MKPSDISSLSGSLVTQVVQERIKWLTGGSTSRAFLDREIDGVAFVANLIQRYQPDVFCLALGSISSPPPGKLPVVVRDQQLRGMVSSCVERFLAECFYPL